jgi:hypothetical protein
LVCFQRAKNKERQGVNEQHRINKQIKRAARFERAKLKRIRILEQHVLEQMRGEEEHFIEEMDRRDWEKDYEESVLGPRPDLP